MSNVLRIGSIATQPPAPERIYGGAVTQGGWDYGTMEGAYCDLYLSSLRGEPSHRYIVRGDDGRMDTVSPSSVTSNGALCITIGDNLDG